MTPFTLGEGGRLAGKARATGSMGFAESISVVRMADVREYALLVVAKDVEHC